MTNWIMFTIAFVGFVIIPIWFMTIGDVSFINKVILTIVLGVVTFFAVKTGGAKRGFISK